MKGRLKKIFYPILVLAFGSVSPVFARDLNSGETFILTGSDSLTEEVNGSSANVGTLLFDGNTSVVSHAIGSTNRLAMVNLTNNSNVTANSSINTAGVGIETGSKLALSDGSSIAADNVTINGTLDLGTTGKTITASNVTVTNGGTIDLGSAAHNISGGFSTTSRSAIALKFDSGAKLQVGLANIAAGTKLKVTSAGDYSYIADGAEADFISSSAALPLTLADAISADATGPIYFTVVAVDSNNAMLVANRLSASSYTNDVVAQGIYSHISQIGASATGEMKNFQQYLDESSDSKARKVAALRSLSPQNDNGANMAVLNIVNTSANIAGDRLVSLYQGNLSRGRAAGDEVKNAGFWAQGFGSVANQDSSERFDGYESKSQGVAIGADRELGEKSHIGVSATYAKSDIESKDKFRNIDIDTYQINAYAGTGLGKFFVNGVLGFAWNEYNSDRSIISSQPLVSKGEYEGQTYSAKLEAGLMQYLGRGFNITPILAATYAHNRVDEHTENGAGNLSLHNDSSKIDFLEGRAGVVLGHNSIINGFGVNPYIKASYGYDFIGDKPTLTSNFVGQTVSLQTQASNVHQASAQFGAGLNIYSSDALTVNANCSFEHKDNYKANSVFARLRYNF
ncbi:MAG: hypothetical protein K0R25_846 [Rickettsiaceae bacterium]|nr:hypothetical protein [Rickettsiaceae bacterium]